MKTLRLAICILLISTSSLSQGLNLPYYTGFDSPNERAGWQEYRTGFLSSFNWNDNGFLGHDYNVGGNSTDTVIDWYVSPALNITSSARISMKVRTGGFSIPTPNNCEIWIGTNDPNPVTGNFSLFANVSYMSPQSAWLDTSFNISTISDSVYFAFKYTTIGAHWMTYSFDTISIGNFVGLKENRNTSFSVYPSPVIDEAQIQFNNFMNNGEISIYSVSGQKMIEKKNVNGDNYKLNLSNLNNGIYFIVLKNENGIVTTQKIVVQ